jgi:hypothetical protein
MPCSSLESTDQYGFSSLDDYQFVSQGIFCSLASIYLSLYPISNGYCGECFVINFITSDFYVQGQLICSKPFTHLRNNFV